MVVFMDVGQILLISPLEAWPPIEYIKHTNSNSTRTKVIVRKGVGATRSDLLSLKFRVPSEIDESLQIGGGKKGERRK